MHVASVSAVTVWDLPLWAWRQYVAWQDAHIDRYKKAEGVHCGRC